MTIKKLLKLTAYKEFLKLNSGSTTSEKNGTDQRKYNAVVFGGTGATGHYVIKELENSPLCEKIVVVRRSRDEGQVHPKIQQVVWKDFSPYLLTDPEKRKTYCGDVKPEEYEKMEEEMQNIFQDADILYITLGTTMKRVNRDKKLWLLVDEDYIMGAARRVQQYAPNLVHVSLLSSIGADAKSSFFYLSSKGRVDNSMETLSQQNNISTLSIFRPSFLHRDTESENFPWYLKWTNALLVGPTKNYKATHTKDVARSMVVDAENQYLEKVKRGNTRTSIFETDNIHYMANNSRESL